MNDRGFERYLTARLVVLALWEPHALFCVAPDPAHDGQPAKRHETRHWFPRLSLPFAVAIHAAKKYDRETAVFYTEEPFKSALKRTGFYPGDPRPLLRAPGIVPGYRPVPLGAIIGLGTVVRIVTVGEVSNYARSWGVESIDLARVDDDDRAMGYWVTHPEDPTPNKTRYAWEIADALMLPTPIPHAGRQEPLYDVDLATRENINSQLRAMQS